MGSLALGAGVQVLVPHGVVHHLIVARGAALPSMMQTCRAAPVAVGMIRHRADILAALAYWLANPLINPATLVFIGFELGWDRAVPRLVLGTVLVFALGAMRAWLFPVMTAAMGHGAWMPPLLAAAGTLFVIPTAGEVPIVQVLPQSGLGAPGAAALLLTLPAVSLPSLVMLGRVVPLRVLMLLAAGTFGVGLVAAGSAMLLVR